VNKYEYIKLIAQYFVIK